LPPHSGIINIDPKGDTKTPKEIPMNTTKVIDENFEIRFTPDGYPDDSCLDAIRYYDISTKDLDTIEKVLKIVLDAIVRAWQFEDRAKTKDGLYVFSTGGWSGHEDILQAFEESKLSMLALRERISGGLFVYAITPQAMKKLQQVREKFTDTVWKLVEDGNE
jgi:hypothetical protein